MIDEVLSRTNPDARILVVGDGDLSFSKSLSEAIISTSRTLTASVLEASEFELVNVSLTLSPTRLVAAEECEATNKLSCLNSPRLARFRIIHPAHKTLPKSTP